MLQSFFLHEIFVFILAVFDGEILVEQIHIEFIKTINAICKYHSFNFVTVSNNISVHVGIFCSNG